ncbi:uncharacterized protein K02A2.6-like [Maniola jurtina]|uniref:uncharacterized protein K02A2.6-like n=1 Tax=Maniola jurtina TaxID=191418 RepID=UPI001E687DC3|nr:uncharacterized protein K02A2.6-like [Maniola jurtina]XP_045777659.1 uncharacterized protein K02A2.6-like [Maniola jurtina]
MRKLNKLLNESEVSLERAYNIAVQMEKTDQDLEVMTTKVHKIGVAGKDQQGQQNDTRGHPRHVRSDNQYNKLCKCCGKGKHTKEFGWFKDRKCRICGNLGHLMAVCRLKRGKKPCNYIENEYEQENVLEDIQNLFVLSDTHVSPYKLELLINARKVIFEIDTGAAISVISKNMKDKYFNDCELYKCILKLRSYVNNLITPLGFISVDIVYDKKQIKAKLYVVENRGPSLIGHDLLKKLNIKTLNINSLSCENIKDTLVSKFPEVFSDELGTYKGEQVNLVLKEKVSPKYFKARPLPFSMKELVAEEINRLVSQGVLTPVKSSEWATPIVPVLKGNGKLRVCGDFKVTINQYLEDDKYPLPKIEDLFVNLNKGEKYSRVDLAHAYQQLMLTEDAKKLVCINTHLGLFQYNRLPFGVKVAPNIFQHIMDQLLAGRPGIAVFMDDVVITGKNDQEHYENLLFVFSQLKEMGLTVSADKCIFCR